MKRTTRWIIFFSILGCGAAAHASDIIQPVNITQTSACNGMVIQPVCVPGGSLTLSTFTATSSFCFADATCQNTAAVSAADAAYTDKNNNFSTTQNFGSSITVNSDILLGSGHSTSVINFSNTNATILGYNSGRLDLQINGSSQFIDTGDQIDINGGTSFQVGGAGTIPANVEVQFLSTTKAFLPPVMTTTQRDAISTPTEGGEIYDSSTHKMAYFNGTIWVEP